MPIRHSGNLIQSTRGSLEVIFAAGGGVGNPPKLVHYTRNNDDPNTPWSMASALSQASISTGMGQGSLIQSNYGNIGNFDVVAIVNNIEYQHFSINNDDPNTPWVVGEIFGSEVTDGSPALIQSNYGTKGDFEVVASNGNGQLVHFTRKNDEPNTPWVEGETFGSNVDVFNPSLIQSNYGIKGNFEVVAIRSIGLEPGQLVHFWRNNDDPNTPWLEQVTFGSNIGEELAFIQSNYGTKGDFEVVAQTMDSELQQYTRKNDEPNTPWIAGPTFHG